MARPPLPPRPLLNNCLICSLAQELGDLEQWFDAVQRVSQTVARDLGVAQDAIKEIAEHA